MKIELINLPFLSTDSPECSRLELSEGIHCICSRHAATLHQLFQYLTALSTPPKGHVRFLNYDVFKLGEAYRNHLSYFGRYPFFPDTFPLFHYLTYTSLLQRLPSDAAKQKADGLIWEIELNSERHSPLSALSPETLKRIDLYQTVLSEAPILILNDQHFPAPNSPDYNKMLSILSSSAETKIIIILHQFPADSDHSSPLAAKKEEDPLPDLPHDTYVFN